MKTLIYFVVLFIFGALLVFGLVGTLAESTDVTTVTEFIALKVISFFVMYVAYKMIVALYQVYQMPEE